jgi:PHD/YefM family antitoxin component YafN of YafNO toxin-antitoxin module
MRVSSAEFMSNYWSLIDKPLSEPITITKDGRDRLVVLPIEEYERLKRRDRKVVHIENFTPAEMEAIAKAEIPPEFAHLDDELKDWNP